ncbi:MAG: IgGFc-binding protein [Polyangiales bacterium]
MVLSLFLLAACGDDDRRVGRDSGGVDVGSEDGRVTPDVPTSGCTPGETSCAGTQFFRCGADGMSREEVMDCPAACDPTGGCVACTAGSRTCNGDVSMVCNSEGTGFVTARDCTENGSTCNSGGYCADACGAAESSRSNIGCEYWPTPLPNSADFPSRYDFRAVVANPNGDAANVRVFRGTTMLTSITVPAGGLQDVILPWVTGQSDASGESSVVVANGAFRLVSDRPVTVAQFNPFEYDNGRTIPDPFDPFGPDVPDYSYTNDASLLLPAHSFTGDYIVSSFVPLSAARAGTFGDNYSKSPGNITIVGTTPEPTTVQVSLAANIAADAAGRFPAATRGTMIRFQLARGEVATIFAATAPDCTAGRPGFTSRTILGNDISFCNETEYDLTGSRVSADNPVAVFGGHLCAYVPYDAPACDHLENQMPPLQTWGTEFVSAPMGDSGDAALNIVRVIGAFEGTTVTVAPAQNGVSEFTLGIGEVQEFSAQSAFRVSSSRGILVTQFLVGQYRTDEGSERGDPAMVVLPPQEQFRRDYTFVTPTSYNSSTMGQSFLLITRNPGQEIFLDGAVTTGSWETVGEREWSIVPVNGGTHSMRSDGTFGVIVYGLGLFTSYAYPAGLNLEEILLL